MKSALVPIIVLFPLITAGQVRDRRVQTPTTISVQSHYTLSQFSNLSRQTGTCNGRSKPLLRNASLTFAWAGSGPLSVTLSGACFTTRSVVQWSGQALETSVESSSQLKAIVPADDLLTPGTASIQVGNPDGEISKAISFTVAQPPTEPPYWVGVDYHSYGTDFTNTSFITQYNNPVVRSVVQSQLQGIANHGAQFISTRIWLVTPPGANDFGQTWRAHFPLSDQEQANLRLFAQDVAAVTGISGNHLQLDITLLWLGAADYTIGSPSTTLGSTALTACEFTDQAQLTIDNVLAAVRDVVRADGTQVVGTVYMDGEIALEKPNIQWFISTQYPKFVAKVLKANLRPSAYLQAECTEDIALDDSFTDATYPILNGHRSIARAYRIMHWMLDQGLYMPPRTDFDCYPLPTSSSNRQLVQRVLDDADATFPTLGVPRSYAIPETNYWLDSTSRHDLGQAWAIDTTQTPRLHRLSFWTTPNSNDGLSDDVAYPFSIEDYLLQ